MMDSNHSAGPSRFDPVDPDRYQAARNSTLASVAVNIALTVLQIVVGYLGKSQALIADGLHSLSDLLSDFLVLYANRQGNQAADAKHPYGHARIETAATLILGIFLFGLGVGLVFVAGLRLHGSQPIQQVHVATLWIAIITLFAKEGLYRYLIKVAKRLRSSMLMANAWHSRSDAASSLVVVVGIGGNLAGFVFLDLLAAALVGFMIARMGWRLGYDALSELIDTGLEERDVERIRATLLATPGVKDLHELRTRRMASHALVDAHVLVDPRISVSEGHHIAEMARKRVLENHDVLDVMVHVDPEDDTESKPGSDLPDRDVLMCYLQVKLVGALPERHRAVLHYLDGKVEAELFVDSRFYSDSSRLHYLQEKINALLANDPYFRAIHVHGQSAQ